MKARISNFSLLPDVAEANRENQRASSAGVAGRPPHLDLTQRQLEVLALLCEGLPTKLICRRLDIAAGTVKVHIRFILRKLGVSTRLQAVVAAHRFGLLADGGVRETGETQQAAAGAPDSGLPRRVALAA